MPRQSRRGPPPRPRVPRSSLTLLNVTFLLLLLVGILLFKRTVGDRTADFMEQFSPAEGTAQGAEQTDLAVDVAKNLVVRAIEGALE